MTRPRQIVAFGGGGFSMESGNPLLDDYVLGLAAAAGRDRPQVCFLPTASGDADHYVVRFYRHFAATRCEPSHISLFRRDRGAADVREHLLAQDLVYVGGGSVISLLGVWRAHGIDLACARRGRRGSCMAGLSAGSLCWFAEAMSGYHGESRPVRGHGLPAVLQRRPLRQGAAPPTRLPAAVARRHARRLRGGGRRGAALRRRGARARGDVATRTRGPTGSTPSAARWSSCRCRRPTSARRSRSLSPDGGCPPPARRRAARAARGPGPDHLRDGRRRLHHGAGEPGARRVRALARARARAAHLPAPHRRRRLRGPDPPLPRRVRRPAVRAHPRVAVPPRLPPGAAARAPARPGRRSTSAAARWSTCSRSGAPTASTRSCARRGRRASCSRASAPAPCAGSSTASPSRSARPTVARGLGFLPGSNSVHYDGEPERRPVYLDAVARGEVPPGWGVDDGVGLLFRGTRARRGRGVAARARAPTASTPSTARWSRSRSSRACSRSPARRPDRAAGRLELRALRAARRGRLLD